MSAYRILYISIYGPQTVFLSRAGRSPVAASRALSFGVSSRGTPPGFLCRAWVGLQARRLQRAAHGLSCPRRYTGSSRARDRPPVLCVGRRISSHWTTELASLSHSLLEASSGRDAGGTGWNHHLSLHQTPWKRACALAGLNYSAARRPRTLFSAAFASPAAAVGLLVREF